MGGAERKRWWATDLALGLGLSAGGAVWAVLLFSRYEFAPLQQQWNVWFGADVVRIVDTNSRFNAAGHYRTSVHPLWALLVSLPANLLRMAGVGAREVCAALVATSAAVFVPAVYAAARAVGHRRPDAVLVTALMLSTGTGMFWIGVPETFVLSAASVLVPLVWLAIPRGAHDRWSAPLQSLASVAITVTDWMGGIVAALLALGRRRSVSVTVTALALLAALTVAQHTIFTSAGRLFDIRGERRYLVDVREGYDNPVTQTASMIGHSLLTPDPYVSEAGHVRPRGVFPRADTLTLVGGSGWLVLLVAGAVVVGRRRTKPWRYVLLVLGGQVILHELYGNEMFLYSLNFAPLVVLVASAPALLERWRPAALGLMGVTALASFAHNAPRLADALRLLRGLG